MDNTIENMINSIDLSAPVPEYEPMRQYYYLKACRSVVSDTAVPQDFRRPGHNFPLVAKKNGVLERNGHTEATVDLMRIAGLKECGLCCEIMKDDGTMMRRDDLIELSEKWNLKFITIKAIQEYRKRNEKLVECVAVV